MKLTDESIRDHHKIYCSLILTSRDQFILEKQEKDFINFLQKSNIFPLILLPQPIKKGRHRRYIQFIATKKFFLFLDDFYVAQSVAVEIDCQPL